MHSFTLHSIVLWLLFILTSLETFCCSLNFVMLRFGCLVSILDARTITEGLHIIHFHSASPYPTCPLLLKSRVCEYFDMHDLIVPIGLVYVLLDTHNHILDLRLVLANIVCPTIGVVVAIFCYY